MDFSGYVPPEAYLILILALVVIGFVTWDWVIPFLSHHVSLH